LTRKPEGKRTLGKPRLGWQYIKTDFKGRWEEGREVDSSGLGREKWQAFVNTVINFWVAFNAGNLFIR
jgi:hypothetical protein